MNLDIKFSAKPPPQFIDLGAGLGGFTRGLEAAGFPWGGACELDENTATAYTMLTQQPPNSFPLVAVRVLIRNAMSATKVDLRCCRDAVGADVMRELSSC